MSKIDDNIKKSMESRRHYSLLSMFDNAINEGDNRLANSFRNMYTRLHEPRIHRLTPFGMSINLRTLNKNAKNSQTLRAIINNYVIEKNSGEKNSGEESYNIKYQFIHILSALQSIGRGAYVQDISDQANLAPRQVASALDILKLERGFKIPQFAGAKNNYIDPFCMGRNLIDASNLEDLGNFYCGNMTVNGRKPNAIGRTKRIRGRPPGCPIETISILDIVPDEWKKTIQIDDKDIRVPKNKLATKLVTFATREFADTKLQWESVKIIPPTEFRLNSQKKPSIYNPGGLYFVLDGDAKINRVSHDKSNEIGHLEMVEELFELRWKFINAAYQQLNPIVHSIVMPNKTSYDARGGQKDLDELEIENLLSC